MTYSMGNLFFGTIVFALLMAAGVANAQTYAFGGNHTSIRGSYSLALDPDGATTYIEEYKNGVYQGKLYPATTPPTYNGRTNGNYTYKFYFAIEIAGFCVMGSCWAGGVVDQAELGATNITVSLIEPPGTPGAISLSNVSSDHSTFTLAWSAASGSPSRYELYEAVYLANGTRIYNGPSRSRNMTAEDGLWEYRVRACNAAGCGPFRYGPLVWVKTKPSVPSAVSGPASDIDGTYTVTVGPASGTVEWYELQEQVDGGSFRNIPIQYTTHTFTEKPSATYGYRTRACNSLSCSGWSSVKTIAVYRPPGTLGAISGPSRDADGTFTLSWTPASGYVTEYRVYKTHNGAMALVSTSSSPSFTESNLANGAYYYDVSACNPAACSGGPATKAVEVLRTPSVPGSIVSTDLSPSELSHVTDADFTLSWPASNGIVDTYQLQERINDGNYRTIQNTTSRSFSVDGRASNSYSYRVRACNNLSCSAYTPTKTITSLAASAVVPSSEPGTLALSHSVDRAGRFNASMPISLPDGVNGLRPKLAITYADRRSHSTEKLPATIGFGWDLSGFSVVTECNGISFGLCYGGKRLFKEGSSTGFYPGDVFRTPLNPGKRFVIELDSNTSTQWLSMQSGDLVYRFGNTQEGRAGSSPTSGLPKYWLLQEVEDSFGNKIIYHYGKINEGLYAYPTSIEYAGYSVEFEYTERQGTKNITKDSDVALHTIRTVVNGVTTSEYHLDYGLENGSNFALQAIQYCGFDQQGQNSTCLPSTNIEWELASTPVRDYTMGVNSIVNGLGAVIDIIREKEGTPEYESDHLFTETPLATPILEISGLGTPYDETALDKTWNVTEVSVSNGIEGLNITEYAYNRSSAINTLLRRRLPDGNYLYSSHRVDLGYYLSMFGAEESTALYSGKFGHSESHLRSKTVSNIAYHNHGYTNLNFEYVQKQQSTTVGDDNSVENAFVEEVTYVPAWDIANGIITSAQTTVKSGFGLNDDNNLAMIEKTVVTVTDFDIDIPTWRIGFVKTEQITTEVAHEPIRTWRNSYVPFGNTLKPQTATVYEGTNSALTRSFDYDSFGNVASITVSGKDIDGGNLVPRTRYSSDYIDNRYPRTVTTPLSATVSATKNLSYDHRFGSIREATDVENDLSSSTHYDNLARVHSSTAANGVVSDFSYILCNGGCGSVAGVPIVFTVHRKMSKSGLQGSPDSRISYDRLGREIRQETQGFTGEWIKVDTVYDDLGRVIKRSLPRSSGAPKYVESEYDTRGRLKYQLNPDGSRTDYAYQQGAGTYTVTTTETLVRAGSVSKTQVRKETYNSLGQLVNSIDAYGTAEQVVTEYGYDSRGNRDWVRVNNDSNTVVQSEFDIAGNRTSIIDPSTGQTDFKYNALGELRLQGYQISTEQRITTAWDYDLAGRVTERVDDRSGPDQVVNRWMYDKYENGSPCKVGYLCERSSDNGFTEKNYYDEPSGFPYVTGVRADIDHGGLNKTYEIQFDYDNFGRVSTQQMPGGFTTFSEYNSFGYSLNLRRDNENGLILKAIHGMDDFGNVTHANIGFSAGAFTQTRSYDPSSGQLIQIKDDLQTHDLQWWSNGTLHRHDRSLSQGMAAEDYTYDGLNRLKTAASSSYSGSRTLSHGYDKLGNLDYKTDSTNGLNATNYNFSDVSQPYRMQSVSINNATQTYAYDWAGNVTAIDSTSLDMDKTIKYGPTGKPVDIRKGTLGSDGEIDGPKNQDQFAYGPDGSRFYSSSLNNGVTTRTIYLFDGAFEVTFPGGGQLAEIRKTYLGNIQHLVDVEAISGTSTERFNFIRTDHLGSVEFVTDESGQLAITNDFDPFGWRRTPGWDAVGQPPSRDLQNLHTTRGFTGHEQLDGTGLIHMNGRVYDPEVGRFISADPIVQAPTYSQSFNRYAYVFNNPLSFNDPSGYACQTGSITGGEEDVPLCYTTVVSSGSGGGRGPVEITGSTVKLFQQSTTWSGTHSGWSYVDGETTGSWVYGGLVPPGGAKAFLGGGGFAGDFSAERAVAALVGTNGGNAPDTFYSGFDPGFLEDFQGNYPVEFSIFRDYAQAIDFSFLSDDSRYYELAWIGFHSHARTKSLQLMSMKASGMVESVYGPMAVLGGIPGRVGSAINLYSNAGTVGGAANIMQITDEAMSIRTYGPQVINEGLFRELYGRGYNRSLIILAD